MGREQIQGCFISWSCIYLFKREAHTQGNRTSEDTAGSLKRVWGPTWIWFHHLQLCLLTHVPSQLSDSWPPVSETQAGPNHTALSFSPVSAVCCEESRTPSTPHLVSGSGHVDAMSTRRRAGVRKGAGFASVLEEPQAASTPQAEWVAHPHAQSCVRRRPSSKACSHRLRGARPGGEEMISGAHSRGRGCWLSPVSITSFLEF